jgi:integrase
MKQLLAESIEDYKDHLRSKDRAKETVRANEVTLRRFLTITGNILTENLHEGHVDAFFVEISKTRSATSRGIDTTVLRGFFRWAIRTRRAGKNGNPMADRDTPKVTPRPWRGFPVSKLPALLDATKHPRDRALLAMAAFLMGRSIEYRLLRIRDVDLDSGYIAYQIPKTRKVDRMPISEELDEELRVWLTRYAQEAGPLDPNWYLLPAKTSAPFRGNLPYDREAARLVPGRQMRDAHKIAKAALSAIGMPLVDSNGQSLREGMHTIRRSMARALYEQLREEGDPNPIETVRSMLNHSTEAQTRRYIGLESDRITRDARVRGRAMFPGLRPGGHVAGLDEFKRSKAVSR